MGVLHASAVLVMAAFLAAPLWESAESVDDVWALAARWVQSYDRAIVKLVATETCTQTVHTQSVRGQSTTKRVLASDFAWVSLRGNRDVVGVRAVRSIDGQTVGDVGRMEELLGAPAEELDRRVADLLAESVRHLQVPSAVNFNFPTFALGYVRREKETARWSVRDGGAGKAAVLHFKETSDPLVRTPVDRPINAQGWLQLDVQTGRVLETSVILNYAQTLDRPRGVETVHYEARVRFVDDPTVRLSVPAVMEDRYEWRLRSVETGQPAAELIIDGRSTYAGFRRFQTDVRVVP